MEWEIRVKFVMRLRNKNVIHITNGMIFANFHHWIMWRICRNGLWKMLNKDE